MDAEQKLTAAEGEGVSEAALVSLLRARRRAGELAAALYTRPFDAATLAGLRAYLAEDAEEAAATFGALCADPDGVRDRLGALLGVRVDADLDLDAPVMRS